MLLPSSGVPRSLANLGWAAPPELSEPDRQGLHRQLKERTRAAATEATAVRSR
jgi:hypothetical protein